MGCQERQEQKDEQVQGGQEVQRGGRQRRGEDKGGRLRSGEADGKEWPPGGMAGKPAVTITGPAVKCDATRRTPASAENETGELISSGGAKDAFVLILPPWEPPGKGDRTVAGWAAGSPLGGSACQSAAGWGFMPGLPCPNQPTHPHAHLVPGCLWLQAGKEGVFPWLGPGSKC